MSTLGVSVLLIDSEEIKRVLNKVRVAREHLEKTWPPKDACVLSVMDFHWAVQDIYEIEIIMLKISFVAEHLRGKVERNEGKPSRVLVKAQQTPEFLRFVAVKELCHLMIDQEDDWSSSGVDTINGLLREWQLTDENGTGHTNPSDPLKSEMLAEIAAIEMMYPREFRARDREKLAANETTIQKIALDHDLPPYPIEQALRHRDILEACWQEIEAELAAKS